MTCLVNHFYQMDDDICPWSGFWLSCRYSYASLSFRFDCIFIAVALSFDFLNRFWRRMPWHQKARWSSKLDCSNPRSLFSWFSRGSFSANWPKSEEPLFWLSSWLQGLFPTLTSIWRSYNRETWWQNGRTSRSSWRWSTGHYHPIDSLECFIPTTMLKDHD